MIDLPISFDPMLIEDKLYQVLERSPHTKQHLHLRVQQIVSSVLMSTVVNNIKTQNSRLNMMLQQAEKRYFALVQQFQNLQEQLLQSKLIKNRQQLSNQKKHIQTQQNEQIVKNMQYQNDTLKKKLQLIQSQKKHGQTQLKLKIKKILTQVEAKNQRITNLQMQLQSNNKELNNLKRQLSKKKQKQQIKNQEEHQFTKLIQKLNKQNSKLKEELAKNKIVQQRITNDFEKLRNKYQENQNQYQLKKQKFRAQCLARDKEQKLLDKKMKQLTNKYQQQQKALMKMRALLKSINNFKALAQKTRNQIQKQAQKLAQTVKKDYIRIMDQIGQKMSKELQGLMFKVGRMGGQLKIYKQQSRVKDQIIERLQRMLDSQSYGTIQLRNQLRGKKREEQKLRKQLVRHYQQTEMKLHNIEQKYRNILKDSSSIYS